MSATTVPADPAVPLSPTLRTLLQRLCQRQTAPQRLVRRARLLLALADHPVVSAVARQLGLSRTTVRLWRNRWLASANAFQQAEAEPLSEAQLLELLAACLTDAPRSGAPATFSPEQIVQLVALACEPPAQSGRPISHWTARELADEAAQRQIVSRISPRSVGLFLKRGGVAAPSQPLLAER